MPAEKKPKQSLSESGGFGNWLNARLFPYLGPPPLGRVDTRTEAQRASESQARACPLCGLRMSEHTVDRTGERTQLYCPAPTNAAA